MRELENSIWIIIVHVLQIGNLDRKVDRFVAWEISRNTTPAMLILAFGIRWLFTRCIWRLLFAATTSRSIPVTKALTAEKIAAKLAGTKATCSDGFIAMIVLALFLPFFGCIHWYDWSIHAHTFNSTFGRFRCRCDRIYWCFRWFGRWNGHGGWLYP